MKAELVLVITYKNASTEMLVVIISVTMTATKAIIITTTSMTGTPPTTIIDDEVANKNDYKNKRDSICRLWLRVIF